MHFISKYTLRNIKANKLRAILLICCIAFSSVLFFVSLAFPKYLRNYHESTMRSYFGNSDIYMQAMDSSIVSLDSIPESLQNNFEYSFGFLALPASKFSLVTEKEEAITYIAGNFNDVQTFNPVRVIEGDVSDFSGKKAVITKKVANLFGWELHDSIRVVAYGTWEYFEVAAIVSNEGLFSEQNEANGPLIMLSKDGVFEVIRKVLGSSSADLTDEALNNYFNLAVFKVKDGVSIQGVASELANIFKTFEVSETVNNKVLNEAVSYLQTPFTACIYLVCGFCALIIYLTCKLTFAERVRQFAVLKSMGATSGSLFFSLLLESAFYGLIGGAISVVFAVLQVYCLPNIAKSMSYITPVPYWYYLTAIGFGVAIAIFSSFAQAIKNTRKSIKQTLLTKEKFNSQKLVVSISSFIVFLIGSILLLCLVNISVKWVSIILFLMVLIALILCLPFILKGAFFIICKIFSIKTFESLYMSKTLPTKNLSVANRLLFFGMFLVFLLSTLITSLTNLSVKGQEYDYNIIISQASASAVSEENLQEIIDRPGVDYAWKGVKLENVYINEMDTYLSDFYALEYDEIARLYSNEIDNFEKINLTSGGILLNKYYRDAKGFKVGDVFSLNVGKVSIETIEFKIVGFIDNYEDWGDMAVCLLDDLQGISIIDGFNSIFVKTNNNYSVEDVISDIRGLPFIGQTDTNPDDNTDDPTAAFLTFTNVSKQQEIFKNQLSTPFLILRTYSVMVLILSLLCIFIGYVLFLREASEYHKTLFVLGMSPQRFERLILIQSIFMTFISLLSAIFLSVLLYFNFENIFNALGTTFTTKLDYFEYSMYGIGMFVGTTLMAYGLGLRFKKNLMKNDKRLFG